MGYWCPTTPLRLYCTSMNCLSLSGYHIARTLHVISRGIELPSILRLHPVWQGQLVPVPRLGNARSALYSTYCVGVWRRRNCQLDSVAPSLSAELCQLFLLGNQQCVRDNISHCLLCIIHHPSSIQFQSSTISNQHGWPGSRGFLGRVLDNAATKHAWTPASQVGCRGVNGVASAAHPPPSALRLPPSLCLSLITCPSHSLQN
ncbi:hypothetical protein K504DRAFT_116425 [Pleomassaria siparia CBS 279.74]|uniref:Uncharacterized protein n=1 Tax=Pleomassaria siparia CBS 279.74 TaxID=1314801 RepID=A0A6G1JV87_9PLEO|nr:hypothetical protein K504DRAFT_116425 [Pleomassaria siparia CBS 279.74]